MELHKPHAFTTRLAVFIVSCQNQLQVSICVPGEPVRYACDKRLSSFDALAFPHSSTVVKVLEIQEIQLNHHS